MLNIWTCCLAVVCCRAQFVHLDLHSEVLLRCQKVADDETSELASAASLCAFEEDSLFLVCRGEDIAAGEGSRRGLLVSAVHEAGLLRVRGAPPSANCSAEFTTKVPVEPWRQAEIALLLKRSDEHEFQLQDATLRTARRLTVYCHPTCLTCSDETSVGCLSCKANAKLTASSTCVCSLGAYPETTAANCQACHITCLSCSGPDEFYCQSCKKNAALSSASTCLCVAGFGLLPDLSCGACDVTCLTCSLADSATSCTQCHANCRLAGGGPSPCTSGYGFYLKRVTGSCLPCHSYCTMCVGPLSSDCTACRNLAWLVSTAPNDCVCMDGYGGAPDACDKCDLKCLKCVLAKDPTSCVTCAFEGALSGSPPSSCLCPSGTFDNPLTRFCSPCKASCLNCTGYSDFLCTACKSNARLVGGQCQCSEFFYASPDVPTCQPCGPLCSSCDAASPNECLSCPLHATLNNALKVCNCDPGYYAGSLGCQACHVSCATCTGGSSSDCGSCMSYLVLLAGSCECGGGSYLSAASCLPCDVTCVKCVSESECSECGAFAKLSTGSCTCLSGYSRSSDHDCKACDPICLSCADYAPSWCTQCFPNAILRGQSGRCECNNGFYPSPSVASCALCLAPCKTCANSATDCTSCVSPASFLEAGVCKCVDGFYQDTIDCKLCDQSCKTCTGPSANQCTACAAGDSLSAGTCSCSPSCSACDPSCATCNGVGPGRCLTCMLPLALCDSLCCHFTCSDCKGVGANQCTACHPNASLQADGTCACVDGTYQGADGRCSLFCPDLCTKCTSNGACTACATQNTDASCSCVSGFYLNSATHSCDKCHPICSMCTGPLQDACTVCAGSNVSLVSGHCSCNLGYYPAPTSLNCVQCHATCSSCFAESDQDCASCHSTAKLWPYSIRGPCVCLTRPSQLATLADCLPCHSDCLSCSGLNESDCLSCHSDATLSAGRCTCNEGFFGSAGSCQACDVSCKTCANSSAQCLSCFPNAQLNVLCTCIDGFYPDLTASNCQQCLPGCLRCKRYIECTDCFSNAHLKIDEFTMRCYCNNSFFPSPSAANCLACHSTCYQCSGESANQCAQCFANAGLSWLGTCDCNAYYFRPASSSSCLSCHKTCYHCTGVGDTDCSLCKPQASFSTSRVCVCNSGYRQNPVTGDCDACPVVCATCDDTACSACKPMATLKAGSCSCDAGTYTNADARACSKCHISCSTCSSGTKTDCTSCKALATLKQLTPTRKRCDCPVLTFQSPLTGACEACHPSCYTCVDASEAQCTECFQRANFLNGVFPAACVCIQGLFPFPYANNCVSCNLLCAQCSGPEISDCTECFSFAKLVKPPLSTCQCQQNAFPDPDAANCKLCAASCASCVEDGPSNCYSCRDFAFMKHSPPSECLCNPGFYGNPDASDCMPCSPVCLTCESTSACLSCRSQAVLEDGTCECKPGSFGLPDASNCVACSKDCVTCFELGCLQCGETTFLHSRTCVSECPFGFEASEARVCEEKDMTPPVPTLIATSPDSLEVLFDRDMNCSILATDIHVAVFSGADSFDSVEWRDAISADFRAFSIRLFFGVSYIPTGYRVRLTFLHPENITSANGVAIDISSVTTNLLSFGTPPASPTLVQSSQQTTTASQGAISAGVVVSFFTGSPAGFISVINNLQLITYIPLSTIDLPADFAQTLASVNVGQMLPNPLQNFLTVNSTEFRPPKHIMNYGMETTLFLSNSFSVVITSALVLGSYVPIFVLSRVPVEVVAQYFRSMLPSLRWSAPMSLWLVSYLDVGLSCLLQISSFSQAQTNDFFSLNYALAGISAVGFFAALPMFAVFSKQNYSKIALRCDAQFNERWKVLVEPFKPGSCSITYHSLFMFRRLALAVCLILLPGWPEVFAILSVLVSTFVFMFVTVWRPFAVTVDQLEATTTEGGTLIIYIAASCFLLDLDDLTRHILETAGIWVVRCAIGMGATMSLLRAFLVLSAVLGAYKQQRKTFVRPLKSKINENSIREGHFGSMLSF